jgi:CO/xanthine dehydrogenase FAD-binding subunit
VYDAIVHTVSRAGRRAVAFDRLFAGPKQTTLHPGELIQAIELPVSRRADRVVFRKVGTRAAQAISKVVAAGQLWLTRDGTVETLRFALGSVAPTVRRLRAVEGFVTGKRLTPDVIDEAAALLATEIAPIDDLRSTAAYRRTVAQRILMEFLSQAS